MIINFYKSLHSDSQRLFNTGQYIVDQIEGNAQNSNSALNSSDNSEFQKIRISYVKNSVQTPGSTQHSDLISCDFCETTSPFEFKYVIFGLSWCLHGVQNDAPDTGGSLIEGYVIPYSYSKPSTSPRLPIWSELWVGSLVNQIYQQSTVTLKPWADSTLIAKWSWSLSSQRHAQDRAILKNTQLTH